MKYNILKSKSNKITNNEKKILKTNMTKKALREWLGHRTAFATLREKRALLSTFYNDDLVKNDWHPTILDSLVDSAIANKLEKLFDKDLRFGQSIYNIVEMPVTEKTKKSRQRKTAKQK